MTDFYCDHGAYGLTTNRIGLDTPTWGVPQEGDGTSISPATAAGTVSIDLTSITSNAGTVSIFGSAAISVGASASGATLATNIAAAINASTATVNATYSPKTAQVYNFVYATAVGATLQIMCRVGSASLNVLGVVWGGTWTSSAPANLTFSGGTGGCWGWFVNPIALGVASSIGVMTYGAGFFLPYAGATPRLSDTIWIRTGGGASKTINYTSTTGYTITPDNFDRYLVFDTNTKWTSDVTNGKLLFQTFSGTASVKFTIYLTARSYASSYIALNRGGFEIEYGDTGGGQGSMLLCSSYSTTGTAAEYCNGVTFRDSTLASISNSWMTTVGSGNNSYVTRVWENCDYVRTYARSSLPGALISVGQAMTALDQKFIGCKFNFNISGVSDPGGLIAVQTAYISDNDLLFQNCQFTGFSSGYTFIQSLAGWANIGNRLNIVVDNCTGLKMPSTYFGMPTATVFAHQETHQAVFSNVFSATQPGFRVEDCRGVSEWVPNDPTPFPYASAVLPGTNAPWSQRICWLTTAPLRRGRPYQAPIIRDFTQLAAGSRTLTLLGFFPTTANANVRVVFGYTDSSGSPHTLVTETILSDTTTWTNASNYPGYVPVKFTVTTPEIVNTNNEITAMVELIGQPPSGSDTTIYINPELVIV